MHRFFVANFPWQVAGAEAIGFSKVEKRGAFPFWVLCRYMGFLPV